MAWNFFGSHLFLLLGDKKEIKTICPFTNARHFFKKIHGLDSALISGEVRPMPFKFENSVKSKSDVNCFNHYVTSF